MNARHVGPCGVLYVLQSIIFCFQVPRFVSKVLSQLSLGVLGELSHVLHAKGLHDGHPQLPSQIATAWTKRHKKTTQNLNIPSYKYI